MALLNLGSTQVFDSSQCHGTWARERSREGLKWLGDGGKSTSRKVD